jgi:hypothetical protein
MECEEPARPPQKYKYRIFVCSRGVQTEVVDAAMKTTVTRKNQLRLLIYQMCAMQLQSVIWDFVTSDRDDVRSQKPCLTVVPAGN